MRLLVDLESGAWTSWTNAQVTSISLKRRDRIVVSVRFGRGGRVVEWPENAAGTFAIKAQFGGVFVALAQGWSPAGYGAERHYDFDLDLNTQELENLFDEEQASLSLLGEVCVTSGTRIFSSAILAVSIANDLIRGDEGTPSEPIDLKASQAEATGGTNNTTWMTPLRTKQAIDEFAGAQVNADWNATTGAAQILNKPSTFTPSAHTHDAATTSTAGFLSAADKTKLDGIASGAQVSVNADWNATTGTAQILNKPSTFTPSSHTHDDRYYTETEVDAVRSGLESAINGKAASNLVGSPVEYVVACSNETSALTAGVAKVTFRAPVAFRLTGVSASVSVAPAGSTLVIDVNNAGNSALSTKLSIDATEKTTATAAVAAVVNANHRDFTADAEITIDIDQIGSTTAGAGLKVTLRGTRM
jgi:hypothetical protein